MGWATPEFLLNTRTSHVYIDISEKLLLKVIADTVLVNLGYDTDK